MNIETEKKLHQVVLQFLKNYTEIVEKENERIGYALNYMLPKSLVEALPFDEDVSFYFPLCGMGFCQNIIKTYFDKHIQDLPEKLHWIAQNHTVLTHDDYLIQNVTEKDYIYEGANYVENRITFTKKVGKTIGFILHNNKNGIGINININYHRNGKWKSIEFLSSDKRVICILNPSYHLKDDETFCSVESNIVGYGYNNIPDINHVILMTNFLYQEYNNKNRDDEIN